jgi:hypothetical protein
MLDDDGCTTVHDEEFKIGPGVIVVGTINTGYKYTGVFELDEALMNRFEFILEVGAMPSKEEQKVLVKRTGIQEEIAREVVKISTILRQASVSCSTRTSLLIAAMVVNGMTLREAFEFAVVRRVPTDSSGSGLRKQVIDLINTNLGVFEQRNLAFDIFAGDTGIAPLEEVAGATSKGVKLYLSKDTGVSGAFLRVQVIQILRSIPLQDVSMEGEYFLTLREAQGLVERLQSEGSVELELFSGGDINVGEICEKLKRHGISGNFSVGAL